ncbi:hypothetical protein AN935_21105 [Bacillus inaquosorum]|nr:hypothetical protein AN935_21105 [Bacillus inaquosorum]
MAAVLVVPFRRFGLSASARMGKRPGIDRTSHSSGKYYNGPFYSGYAEQLSGSSGNRKAE